MRTFIFLFVFSLGFCGNLLASQESLNSSSQKEGLFSGMLHWFGAEQHPSGSNSIQNASAQKKNIKHETSAKEETKQEVLTPQEKGNNEGQDKKKHIPFEKKLLSHEAKYTVKLDQNKSDDIVDVKGEMTIKLIEDHEGWSLVQTSSLLVYGDDGSSEQISTEVIAYETKDGRKYVFDARTLRNGEAEDRIKGVAILATPGGAGIVEYELPDKKSINLPIGTIFPTQHLLRLLDAIKEEKKSFSCTVFDGSSEVFEPVDVNTIIQLPVPSNVNLLGGGAFKADYAWPVNIAVYPVKSPMVEPDYELSQNILPGGVMSHMTLDYDSFKVNAILQEIKFLTKNTNENATNTTSQEN